MPQGVCMLSNAAVAGYGAVVVGVPASSGKAPAPKGRCGSRRKGKSGGVSAWQKKKCLVV